MSYGQTANFTASVTSGCAPLLVQFTSTSTGTVSSYYWTLGNSVTSINQNPSTSYTSPGNYTVTLRINGPGGSTITKTNYITVYPPPTISFTYSNSSGCASLLVPFTANVTAGVPGTVNYSWYYGDGYSGSGATSSHLYTTAGSYGVTLSATNSAGCTSSLQLPSIITVYPKPGSSFGATKTTYCNVPATVNFINTTSAGTGPYSYYWDFGDGSNTTATSTSQSHTYNTAGTFTVMLVTTDALGCKDTVLKTNYITTHIPSATFSAPTQGCKDNRTGYLSDSILFKNTTVGGTNTIWDFGDNTGATGDSAYHQFADTLSYTVTMITLNGGCYDTVRKAIKIYPNPSYVVKYSPDPNCGVPATFTFWTIPAATSYSWAWGTGGTSTAAMPTKIYTTGAIIDTVTVYASDSHGCKDTSGNLVYVHDPYAQLFGPSHGCVPFGGKYSARIRSDISPNGLFPDAVTSYYWDFGDGSTSTMDTPTHYYTAYGDYNLAIKFTTASGCTIYDTILIHAGTPVHPSFTATPNPVCAGEEVYFTNTTGVPASSVLTYTWDVGDGAYTPVNNMDAAHIYIIPGIYTIKLISTNNGCDDTAIKVNWMVVNGPNANFTDTVLCINQHRTIHTNNMSIGATSQLWFFGDNTTDTSFSPYHTYATGGTYMVTLTTYNSTTGCRDTLSMPITVGPPILRFTALDSSICTGDTLKITSTYVGAPAAISFSVTGAAKVNGPNAAIAYFIVNTSGFHTVTMTSNMLFVGCIDTLVKPNYVFSSRPTARFKASPLIGCTPLFVTFTDTSLFTPGAGIASHTWSFGNGSASTTAAAISNTYTVNGKYTIKLKTVDSNGCADSLTKANYVEARHPTAAFQVGVTVGCVGQSLTFSNASTGATGLIYRWTFGDGDTSSLKDPAHSYRAPGSYTIRLIAIDSSGCSDTLIKTNHINITRPVASFTMSDSLTVCPPLNVSFVSTSVNANAYNWNFGNGSTAAFATPTSLFTSPNVYKVQLVVTDINGCPDTASKTVRVLGYAGALTYTPLAGCVPLTVNFLATISGVPKIVWDFSDGDTALAVGTTISHTYRTSGKYIPKLIFYDGSGCSASSTGIDTIKVDEVFAGFKVLPPCERTPLMLVDTSYSLFSSLYSWRWDFGNGQIATGQSVPRIYATPGQYPVTLVVTNSRGCVNTLKRDITIYPLPIITGSPDTALCIPDAVTISAKGGVSYTWSPGTSLSCVACTSPAASPTVPTAYVVTGTDSNGCANRDTVKVGIQAKTTFTVTSGGEICLGKTFQLLAGGATVYQWTPAASLDDANSAAPIAKPTATTTYIATGKEGSCLADTHMVKVIVNPVPTVDAGKDERIVAGNSIQLQASGSGIDHLLWAEDSLLSCSGCYAPDASPKITTVFHVTAYTTKGCTATDSVTVRVLCDNSQLFIPNTFTPNGDGLNDFFFPRGRGIDIVNSFRVYSRWGELLFERNAMRVNDEFAGWNGTHKGQKLSPDVYVYIIEASCDTGEPIMWKGDVTLMR